MSTLPVPNGVNDIIATFGDIYKYIGKDGTVVPEWQSLYMATTKIPFAMALSWAPSVRVTHIQCNHLLVSVITTVCNKLVSEGLQTLITTFGGCYAFRAQRRSHNKLSAHAWGIALDINPETNELGTEGNMDPRIVKIFEDNGFYWGGNFLGIHRDPMHFQYCTGY